MVKISGDDFRQMVERFPNVRVGLEAVAAERQAANAQRLQMVQNVPIDQFLSQGLMEAQSLLILDLENCTRCDACVNACADAHDGVTRLVREGLRFENYLVATSCRQCRDPLCMVGCPVGSIRRRNSLEVIIEDWCIGCGLCARNCPYGNINLHPFDVDGGGPGTGRKEEGRGATESDVMRLVHAFEGAELRLCVPTRCGASRGSAKVFCGIDGVRTVGTTMKIMEWQMEGILGC